MADNIGANAQGVLIMRRRIARIALLWGIATLLSYPLLGAFSVLLALVTLGGLVIWVQLELFHFTVHENFHHYKQFEALLSLFNLISIQNPLPPMRLWAASPDFVTIIFSYIRQCHPQVIVEAGSGVSTLLSAYLLKTQQNGRIYSLEHDTKFAQVSEARLVNHHLTDYASILHAPLQSVALKGTSWQWYDPAQLSMVDKIDLLVIDGPPRTIQKLARYPALPLLFDKLNSGAHIIIDDYQRPDEQAVVKRWLDEFALDLVEKIDNEKGAVVLRKR